MKKKNPILNPSQVKFTKQHKGILAPIEYKDTANRVVYGTFGLKVLQPQRLSVKQLESARRQLVRVLTKHQYLWIRILPDIPVTAKPKEVRMGKGKGAVNHWIVKLKAGHILFEISEMPNRLAFRLLTKAAKKLSLPCVIVSPSEKIDH